ncbi:hypothetical protein LXL04_032070 [Taraxacum kok-saghyz]
MHFQNDCYTPKFMSLSCRRKATRRDWWMDYMEGSQSSGSAGRGHLQRQQLGVDNGETEACHAEGRQQEGIGGWTTVHARRHRSWSARMREAAAEMKTSSPLKSDDLGGGGEGYLLLFHQLS